MLNRFPLWKYLLIVVVLGIAFIYSAPNLYPDDPAVQITGAATSLNVTEADLDRVSKALAEAGIEAVHCHRGAFHEKARIAVPECDRIRSRRQH